MSSAVGREYAGLARRYDRRWARYNDRSLALLRPFLAGSHARHVVDAGCGTANLAARLAEWGVGVEHYVGVDLSSEMLLAARAKLAAAPFLAAVLAADVAAIPIPGGPIQTVVSASALHDWARPERALAEIRRVLGNGGRLVLLDWCRDSLPMSALATALRILRNPFHRMYSSHEAAELIRGAGFRIVRHERAPIHFPWELMVFDALAE